MKKAIFTLLIFLSFLVLFIRFGLPPIVDSLKLQGRAGLKITTLPEAKVFINGLEVGQTPYQNENLEVKEYPVVLVGENGSWQGKIKLTSGTLSVINREIAPDQASSSGEILILESGKGMTVVSNPEGAQVEIDGKNYGKTPLKIVDLEPGEHNFMIFSEGYLKRSIRAKLPENMHLFLDVDLAVSEMVINDPVVPTTIPSRTVIVGQTPNGFLRVRNRPSTTGSEITRVTFGTKLEVIEELSGWYKVKLEDGKQGYVSASYVSKQ